MNGEYLKLERWSEGVGCVDKRANKNIIVVNISNISAHLWCVDLFRSVGAICEGFVDVL